MTNRTNANICFAYMYRDASNYKQHGEVIFSNEKLLSLEEVEKQIRSFLNDGEFFIARQVHLEERFFDVLYDDDHPWHEFVRVMATDYPTFDPEYGCEHKHKRDIAQFLSDLEKAHRAGWDEMNVREDLARQFTEQKRALKQRLESSASSTMLQCKITDGVNNDQCISSASSASRDHHAPQGTPRQESNHRG